MNVSDDYGPEFFAMHEPWRADYDAVANILAKYIPCKTVLDLGCGNGFLIEHLATFGKEVRGIDGSAHAAAVNPKVEVCDLTVPIDVGTYDLVISTEVAEHLAPEHADTLIDTICSAARSFVFFSAAAPGSGGHLHINEQEKPYWIQKFSRRRFQLDHDLTYGIAQELEPACINTWWFAQNCMVFRRAGI